MNPLRFPLTALAAAALLGCAAPAQQATAPIVRNPGVQPVQSVRHGVDADTSYRTGRYFQGQVRFDEAIAAYERALQSDPRHADSLNALGVIYSVQKRGDLAQKYFEAALQAAPGSTPASALVHNNLGYHLLANGRAQEAMEQFRQAAAIDPANAVVAANIAAARVALGDAAVAVPVAQSAGAATAMATSAAPLPQPPAAPAAIEAPVVQVMPAQPTATPAGSPQLASPPMPVAPVVAVASVPANLEVIPASAAPLAKIAGRVEVANGNGTTGLARGVSRTLASADVSGFRLTNDKPFGVRESSIQYVAGAESSAQRLAERLPVRLPLAQVASLERNATVRVLLGRDFPAATINRSTTRSSS